MADSASALRDSVAAPSRRPPGLPASGDSAVARAPTESPSGAVGSLRERPTGGTIYIIAGITKEIHGCRAARRSDERTRSEARRWWRRLCDPPPHPSAAATPRHTTPLHAGDIPWRPPPPPFPERPARRPSVAHPSPPRRVTGRQSPPVPLPKTGCPHLGHGGVCHTGCRGVQSVAARRRRCCRHLPRWPAITIALCGAGAPA